MLYPCPACGFETFDDPVGSYEICPICNWQDDAVQLRFPFMQGGANKECLFQWQQKTLREYPLEIREIEGFQRDNSWRPLTKETALNLTDSPETGFDYFQAIGEQIPTYYWRK